MGVVYRHLTAEKFQKSVTADTTLTLSDVGKTILLDAVGEAITLPAATAGAKFKFLVTAAIITSNWTVAAAGAIIYGQVVEAGLVQLASAETTLTVVATSQATFGDWFELESDGTNWYLSGQFAVASSFTSA